MTQEALPALSNQNDEEAARDEKGPEIFILSLAQDTCVPSQKKVAEVVSNFWSWQEPRRHCLLYPTRTTKEPLGCEAGPAQMQPGTKRATNYVGFL
jgi:hypothetical protein